MRNIYFIFINGFVIYSFTSNFLIFSYISILLFLNYFYATKDIKKLKEAFAKKVSSKVMEELIKNDSQEILAPKEKEITIFFSDVRDFTTISEKLKTPKNVIEMLNIYMTPMVDIITSYEGTIDKFIGDAIMAYWNAPIDVENHADKAVKSAIEQIKALQKVNKIIKEKFNIEINIGMGINTGIATIGEMGTKGRAVYTIIGDSVNTASRLEGLCKYYGAKIIISEATKNKLKEKYIIRELDIVQVKGKNEGLKIYEVIDFGEKSFDEYYEALQNYRNKDFEKAYEQFKTLYEKHNDKIYHIYLLRCKRYKKNPSLFSLIYKFDTK